MAWAPRLVRAWEAMERVGRQGRGAEQLGNLLATELIDRYEAWRQAPPPPS